MLALLNNMTMFEFSEKNQKAEQMGQMEQTLKSQLLHILNCHVFSGNQSLQDISFSHNSNMQPHNEIYIVVVIRLAQ